MGDGGCDEIVIKDFYYGINVRWKVVRLQISGIELSKILLQSGIGSQSDK
jgi:hypothetical protein